MIVTSKLTAMYTDFSESKLAYIRSMYFMVSLQIFSIFYISQPSLTLAIICLWSQHHLSKYNEWSVLSWSSSLSLI